MLSEIGKNVVIRYHAETAAAQANVRQLQKTQEKHDATLKMQQEGEIKGLEAKIAKYAKYAMYAGAAFAAVKVSIEAMTYSFDQQELRERAAGHNIDALREATRGLVSETDLLKLAQSANLGVMKTSADDLIILAKAMDVYKERGYDAAKVTQDFGEYLQTGKAKALKDYGLQIDEARGSVAQYKQTMEQLNVVAREQAQIEEDGGDRMQQRKIQIEDATAKLKESFGTLVATAEPLLTFMVETITMILDGWRQILDLINSIDIGGGLARTTDENLRSMVSDLDREYAARRSLDRAIEEQEAIRAGNARTSAFLATATPAQLAEARAQGAKLGGAIKSGVSDGVGTLADWMRGSGKADKGKGGKGGAIRIPVIFTMEDRSELDEQGARLKAQAEAQRLATEKERSAAFDESVTSFRAQGFSAAPEALEIANTSRDLMSEYEQFNSQQSDSILKKMFGEPQEFEAYAEGLGMLQNAGRAAFEALITGSGSAAEAFKAMIAQNMMSLASEMFGRSIYEAAMAVGSLAMYDFKGAALHGKAAAMYAVGAGALGMIASQMGGGAGAGSGSGGAATGAALPSTTSSAINSSPGEARGKSVTVVVGDDFADDSPRKRQQRAQRMVALGLRTDSEVTYS